MSKTLDIFIALCYFKNIKSILHFNFSDAVCHGRPSTRLKIISTIPPYLLLSALQKNCSLQSMNYLCHHKIHAGLCHGKILLPASGNPPCSTLHPLKGHNNRISEIDRLPLKRCGHTFLQPHIRFIHRNRSFQESALISITLLYIIPFQNCAQVFNCNPVSLLTWFSTSSACFDQIFSDRILHTVPSVFVCLEVIMVSKKHLPTPLFPRNKKEYRANTIILSCSRDIPFYIFIMTFLLFIQLFRCNV